MAFCPIMLITGRSPQFISTLIPSTKDCALPGGDSKINGKSPLLTEKKRLYTLRWASNILAAQYPFLPWVNIFGGARGEQHLPHPVWLDHSCQSVSCSWSQWFIHPFSNYLLSAYFVPCASLGSWNSAVSKKWKSSCFLGA